MRKSKKLLLGEDLPKQNPWQHDKLGYAPLAERLAKTLISTITPNGYVIGLHGKWGSGKSTMLNFILAHISKHNEENPEDKIIHIDFRPWLIAGHQDLIVGFFKILTEKLTETDPSWKRNKQKIARAVGVASTELVDAAAKVALILDPSCGIVSGVASKAAKGGIGALIKPFLDEPSLQAAYKTLREQLTQSKIRFLVTIDDIDRLNDAEVQSVMHMVKSVGQLPYVTYLLSYDREVVWTTLDRGVTRQGPKFGEKIVQQEIELPRLVRHQLLSLLDDEIGFMIADTPNESRWHDIITDGINRWITTPRDVVRLSNAVKFTWPAIQGEVDAQDVLAMEGLRLFDTAAFNWIRDNRDFLFSDGAHQMGNDDEKARVVDQLRRRFHIDVVERVLDLLCVLFPQTKKHLKSKGTSFGETYESVMKRRGIGSTAGYDAYFAMILPNGIISKSIIDAMVRSEDGPDLARRTISRALVSKTSNNTPQLSALLDELRIRFKGGAPAAPNAVLFNVLFEMGEAIIGFDVPRQAFELPPRVQLSFLLENMLELWGRPEADAQIISAFEVAESVGFLSEIYCDLGQRIGILPDGSTTKDLIGNETFEALGKILIQKITTASRDGTLENAPYYFNIIRAWQHLAGTPAVRTWLETGIGRSAVFLARISEGLLSHTIGTSVKVYSMHDRPNAELYDLQKLHDASHQHLDSPDLSEDQRNRIQTLFESTGRMLKGQRPEEE